MPLGDTHRTFLAARASRRNIGLIVLPAALIALVVLWGTLFVYVPLAVNPWTVIGRIEQQTFEPGTLTMYAIICTVLVNVVIAMLCAFLVLAIAWARHERRYHKLLAPQLQVRDAPPVRAPATVPEDTSSKRPNTP
jgi:hypothetical protein